MLPNKMKISERATKSLMRLQSNTGLTPNIGSRLAFFSSINKGYRFDAENHVVEHTGRELDKHTWLGDSVSIVEMLLKQTYPSYTKKELYVAWVSHVDNGTMDIENIQNLSSLSAKISS